MQAQEGRSEKRGRGRVGLWAWTATKRLERPQRQIQIINLKWPPNGCEAGNTNADKGERESAKIQNNWDKMGKWVGVFPKGRENQKNKEGAGEWAVLPPS